MKDKARILVVDREPDWRTFVAHVLHKGGYIVHLCGDTRSALQEIRATNFDLIIVDALLMDLLRSLAMEPVRYRLLVVTAAPSVPKAISAYRWGALDYINKAFGESSLLATVELVLQKQPAQQRLPV